MSERLRGVHDKALYKSTFTVYLYLFTSSQKAVWKMSTITISQIYYKTVVFVICILIIAIWP